LGIFSVRNSDGISYEIGGFFKENLWICYKIEREQTRGGYLRALRESKREERENKEDGEEGRGRTVMIVGDR